MNRNREFLKADNRYIRLTRLNRKKKHEKEIIDEFEHLIGNDHNIFDGRKMINRTGRCHLSCILKRNRPYQISLLKESYDYHRSLQYIVIEGREGIVFPFHPTYTIAITKEKVQYIWKLTKAYPEEDFEKLRFISEMLCYLYPGTKSLHHGMVKVWIPGIVHRLSGKTIALLNSGSIYELYQLKNRIESLFPVVGMSLKKYLKSEKVYIKGLKSTRQFIALKRVNMILNHKWKKKIFQERKQNILFLLQNFLADIGMKFTEAERMIWNWCRRRGYKITEDELYVARPVKRYIFTNKTICSMLGNEVRAYFPYKEKVHKVCMESIETLKTISNFMRDYDVMIPTGGTGQAWFEEYREYFKGMTGLQIIPGNRNDKLPMIYSNVRGYYMFRYMILKAEKHETAGN